MDHLLNMTFQSTMSMSDEMQRELHRLSARVKFIWNHSKELEIVFRYNPRYHMTNELYLYSIYVHPNVCLITVISLIVMFAVMIKSKVVLDRYTFMIVHTVFDLLALTIPVPFQMVFLQRNEYMDYHWCTPYQIMTVIVPGIFYSLSTWMKIGMAFQKLIIIKYPIKSRMWFSGKRVGFAIVGLTLIGTIVNSTHMYRNAFKKTVIFNEKTNELEYKCIAVKSYIQLIDSEIMRIFLKICPLLFRSIGPMILLVLCCIGIVAELIKQDNKRTTMTVLNNTTGPYRQLAKVVVISTFMYAIATIPKALEDLLVTLDRKPLTPYIILANNPKTLQYKSFMNHTTVVFALSKVLEQIDVVLTVVLYVALKSEFRTTVKDMICPKINRGT